MSRLVVAKWWLTLSLSYLVVVSASDGVDGVDIAATPVILDLKNTIQVLREQVNALIDHRQQDYNALEESLKHAIEKNTELAVLRNQVRQLRKEVSALGGGSGNEAKNERLRVKWLGSAVTELRAEIAEVLGTKNASEEFAQRSRMRSELDLLKGDVSQVGRGVRDLGGRLTKIEGTLGTIRLDIFAVKERAGQLTRICADVNSQLSTVQIEMKSLKCDTSSSSQSSLPSSPLPLANDRREAIDDQLSENQVGQSYEGRSDRRLHESPRTSQFHHRHTFSRSSSARRVDERLNHLEHKISLIARRPSMLEKRVVYENGDELTPRVVALERGAREIERRLGTMSKDIGGSLGKVDESIIRLFETVESLGEKFEKNKLEEKREVARVEVNAVRKYAELSLTREELGNLRRTVQALSVSASKLQEKSDAQQESLADLKRSFGNGTRLRELELSMAKAGQITKELEHVEDNYRTMVDSLPGNCEDRDGLTLLAPGAQASPLLVSCHDGWIVVGRRIDGMVDFDRTWNEYAEGFGSPVNEFWLGNEALHRLTRDNCTSLRIDLTDIYGSHWRADYENFVIDSENTGYRLSVSGYSGNATDALSYQNQMSFSAKDRDMDISSADCAANYRGGWWFSHCQHANLNGRYSLGLAWYQSGNNRWMAVASSTMSVKRKSQCRTAGETR